MDNVENSFAKSTRSCGSFDAVDSFSEYLALVERLREHSPDLVHLNTTEAAIFLRCTNKCLERRRIAGLPPRFKKQGAKVLYQLSDLLASLEERNNTCKTST